MKLGRVLAVLIAVGAFAGGYAWWRHHGAEASQPAQQATGHGRRARPGTDADPIPVLTATARTSDVPIYLDALGTIQAFQSVSIKPMIDGPLSQVLFTEGQDVHQGDVLARIDARPYQAALDQALAKKAQDEANLANARLDLARYQKLVATNYTSGQTADTQKATVAVDEALIRQDDAQIATARTNLSYTTIASPLDGRTGIRQVDQGNIVHASDTVPLTVITQLKPISVVFNLPQQTLPQVQHALQGGPAPVMALPQGGGPVIDRGNVAVLDNQVDQATGTIKLKATFPNPDLALWPGGFINVRLQVDKLIAAITVPPSAVQRGPQGAYVYVLAGEDKVSRRAISTGYEDEDISVVTAGLEPGDRVVTDGASRLTDGATVRVAAPPTTPEAEVQPRHHRAPGQSKAPG